MHYLLLPLRIVYSLYAAIVLVVVMFLIIPFVLIASFLGRITGGNIIYRLCTFWGDAFFLLIGIWHRNEYEVPHNRDRQYIFLANHISYLDAPIIVKSIRQPVRILGKAEMAKLPFFGFIYKNAVVTVDRSSPEKRAKSVRVLKSVLKKGISIFIFPEGTFNQTKEPLKSFFDGAFRMAIETQTPIKPLLFLDSYSRMHYRNLFTLTPGISRCVYLEEIPVKGLHMKDVQLLKQKVYKIMEEKLVEYGAAWSRESYEL